MKTETETETETETRNGVTPMVHRRLRRSLWAAGGLLAGGVLLAILGLAVLLHTEYGRHWIASRLAALASSPGTTVTIGALEGQLPFRLSLIDVTVADHKGRWLTAHRTDLQIDGDALLSGRLDVVDATVDRLNIARPPLPLPLPLPMPEPTAASLASGAAGPETRPDVRAMPGATPSPVAIDKIPPVVPALPLPVTVRRLVVNEIALGPSIGDGEPALLHAEGDAQLGEHHERQRLDLDLTHRDGQPGNGHLHVEYAPDTDRLDLDLAAAEPPGGVLARALRLRDLPALTFKAAGSAPLADWHGSFTADAGMRPVLAADATIHRTPAGYLIAIQGGGDVTPLLYGPWTTLIGPTPRLNLELLADDDGGLALQPASSLTTAAAALTAEGKLDPDTNRLTLGYRLTPVSEVLVAAGVLPAGSHWRQAVLSGTIEGAPAVPTLTAVFQMDDPAGPTLTAHSLNATVRATPKLAPGTTIASGDRAVTLDAAVDYLSGADSIVTRLAGPHAQLSLSAVARPDSDEIRLDKVTLTVAAGRIAATGMAAPGSGHVNATGHFTVDHLSRLLGPFGLPLSGVADLNLSLRASRNGAQLDVSGTAGTLQTGNDAIDRTLTALLDDGLRVKGTVTIDDRGALHARDWHLDGHKLSLSGQADLTNRRLDAAARMDLPQVETLAEPLGLPPLAGTGHLEASWHGPLTAATGKATLVVSNLSVAGHPLGRNQLDLTATGLPANPRVQIALRAANGVANQEPITATAALALSGDRKMLLLDALTASQGDNRMTGTLSLALDGATAAGHLNGQFRNLGTLATLANLPLAGRGRFDTVLHHRDDETTLSFAGGTNALRLGGSVAAPTLTGSDIEFKGSAAVTSLAELAAGHVTGSLAITGQAVKAGPVGVPELTANLESNAPGQASFRVVTPATPGQPTSVDLAGNLGTTPDGVQLRLIRLAGQFGNVPVTLARPATLDIGETRLAVTGLRLAGPDFHLSANGAIGGDGLSGRLEADRLPLALLHLLQPALPGRGHVDVDATLSGTPTDPHAEITAHIKDAGMTQADATDLDLGNLDGTVQAHWQGGRFMADGDIRASDGASLHWRGETPLVLTLNPLMIEVPKTAALRGSASGSLDLAAFGDLLADRGDHLAGKLTADITVGGTVATPDLGGTVTVSDGRYENQALGSVIDHISAHLTGTGGTFTIDDFSGHTAGDGEVAATGTLTLTPTAGGAFDVHLTAHDARLVQVDSITADTDADLTLTGSLTAARLAGSIAVRRADIRLPDRLPSEVVELHVVEAHPQPPTPAPGNGAAPESSHKPVLPGATIRVTAPPTTAAIPAPPGRPKLSLALTVSAHSNIFVHGRGVDSEFSADLKVSGPMPTPVINGTLTLLHGRLDLLGKEFDVKRGTITFADRNDLDPELDLLAEARTGSITADAEVTGHARSPRLVLTSVPVMPQDEILARLLFDKPASQLGALEAVQLADSAAQLTGLGGSSTLVEHIRRSLGIDRLDVTSSTPGAKRETVEAGRYVSNDVYLGVQQGPTGDSSRAKVEVAITGTVQAEVDVGVRADPQVGLKFQWDY